MIVSHPSDEHIQLESQTTGGQGHSMSLTWPRSNLGGQSSSGGGGGPHGLTSVPPLKGAVQINADALGVAGGKFIMMSPLHH